ncbi:hypothetical protein L13192_07969 [Pyrenophora tritici-repentis]|nr:hypothetical protein L13192_07969 [Pyrenophora tritici-repentis]
MHPSTIAAILAFAAGMPANAAPATRRSVIPTNISGVQPISNDLINLTNAGGLTAPAISGSRVGKASEGAGDAVGAISDILTIDQAVQASQPAQKRDAQRGRGRVIGNVLEGVGGAIGGAVDLITIGGAIQGQQKRDAKGGAIPEHCIGSTPCRTVQSEILTPIQPSMLRPAQKRDAQRSKGKVFGNIAEGVAGAISGAADLITIGGAVQGQQKRDAQRGRGRVIGNVLEGVGGAIGGAVDLITIGGAVQGQQKRDAKGGAIPEHCIGSTPCRTVQSEILTPIQPSMLRPAQKRDAQRSKGKVFGNIAEGVAGAISSAADLITIGGAVQGQGQPAQKREA